jgi:ABC-type thiamin/hydroxymethylpyrimidine transport system permease subunit
VQTETAVPPVFGKEMCCKPTLLAFSAALSGCFFVKERMNKNKAYYFSTRDLMMMAALAAMGGIASTYINMIGDFFQSLLGFAGTTQWAAGLHIIWIMLAAALINKGGAATATGIIKGFVELLSGNTHGLLVLIIDIVAGLIIDMVLIPQKDKKPGLLFLLAAGLGSASNIFIFQYFASIPKDILTFFAILISSSVSFVSGVVFGGILVKGLLASLEKIGFYKFPNKEKTPQKKLWPVVIMVSALLLAAGSGWFYIRQQARAQTLSIIGDVAIPFEFPIKGSQISEVEIQAELNGVSRKYTGYRLSDIVDYAQPMDKEGVLLVTASDGYSFFISMDEVYSNANLIISQQKAGNNSVFNIVGAKSSKAWIRGVSEVKITAIIGVEISGSVTNPFIFHPEEWVSDMDSTLFKINGEQKKLQGVPLPKIWEKSQPDEDASKMVFSSKSTSFELEKAKLLGNDSIRIFVNLTPEGTHFLIGKMTGEIIFADIAAVEIK